jgi:hypothetical protein
MKVNLIQTGGRAQRNQKLWFDTKGREMRKEKDMPSFDIEENELV